jgi:NADPH:quinone reductase-like Zn-dependent oxidoreductase
VLLGKAMNLSVVALSRSPDKRAKLKDLGADLVFNPGDRDLHKQILTAIAPRRVDLAIDNVGARCSKR